MITRGVAAVHCQGRAAFRSRALPLSLPPLFLGAPTGPRAAQAARLDEAQASPLDAEARMTLAELPEDIYNQVMSYAIDYGEQFERADPLPEDRVGVPYPRGDALYGKHKEDFAIPEIGVCGVFRDFCNNYLVTALLANERAYWERKGSAVPGGQIFVNVLNAFRARAGEGADATLFDAVLDAIDRRDGVRVVTLPKGNGLERRLALKRIDEEKPLTWPNATAIVLRARHWFEEYAKRHVTGVVTLGRRSEQATSRCRHATWTCRMGR